MENRDHYVPSTPPGHMPVEYPGQCSGIYFFNGNYSNYESPLKWTQNNFYFQPQQCSVTGVPPPQPLISSHQASATPMITTTINTTGEAPTQFQNQFYNYCDYVNVLNKNYDEEYAYPLPSVQHHQIAPKSHLDGYQCAVVNQSDKDVNSFKKYAKVSSSATSVNSSSCTSSPFWDFDANKSSLEDSLINETGVKEDLIQFEKIVRTQKSSSSEKGEFFFFFDSRRLY